MTAPVVAAVAVEVLADAKSLAKSLRKEVEAAFKGLDLNKLVKDSVGNARIKLPVEPDFDAAAIPEKVRRTRVPKVPVTLDPVLGAFQAQVKRETAALAKQANANIPIGADTAGLRAKLGAELAEIQRQLKATVPTEPGAKAAYEAKLKALVEEASAHVEAHVKVKPGKDLSGLSSVVGNLAPNFAGISGFFTGIGSGIQALGDGIAKFAGEAAQGGSQLAGSIAAAAGPIGSIIALLVTAGAAMGGLGVAAILAVPAFTAAAGAAAAIPAALAGLGAVVGTLGLGFRGIAEAFKPKTGAANAPGAAAQQGRQIAAAGRQIEAARRGIAAANRSLASSERGLQDAQLAQVQANQRLVLAQQAVNRARVEAAKDVDDLNRSLRGAKLSEEDAALSVTDALRALNTVKLTGNIPDIQRADLAYREALQTLDEATATTTDLSQKTADANRKGVEGSDKVKAALRDQADAHDAVRKAQEGVLAAQDAVLSAQDGVKSSIDGLKSAQDSLAQAQQKTAAGAAAAAAKLIPLAKNAQAFVDTIKALKPAFEALRLDVQQRLFAGLDQTVTGMWKAWKGQLHTTLGSFADDFNVFLRNLGASASQPKFISGIAAGADGARQGLKAIGDAITTSLVPAFGELSRAAGPFLTQVGQEIAGIVTEFSNWILQSKKSGALQTFFDKAAVALHEIFTTGKLVGKIIGDLFAIFIGAQQTKGQTPLDSFNTALKKIDTYLSDPKHQQQIRDMITDVAAALVSFGQLSAKIDGFLNTVSGTGAKKSSSAGGAIGRALIAGILAGVGEGIKASATTWLSYFSPIGPLVGPVKQILGIKSPSTVFAGIGRNLIAGLIGGLQGSLGSLVGAAVQLGRTAVIGLGNGIASLYGNLSARAAGLRTTIVNTVAGAGSWLYNAGRNVITGLIRGIESLVGTLGSYLGDIGTFIQQHKGPPEKDKVLLYGAGQLIMGGLISGIGDRKDALAAELSDVASIVAGTTLPSLGAGFDTAFTSSLAVNDRQSLVASWKTGTTGDQLLDALARHIDLRHNGDVQAALSRT